MAGEPRVLVCVTQHHNNEKDIDVEVVAHTAEGTKLAEQFKSYEKPELARLWVFAVPVTCAWTDHYEVNGTEVEELEHLQDRIDINHTMDWLIKETSPHEVWRLILTARRLMEAHPEWSAAQAMEISMLWERG